MNEISPEYIRKLVSDEVERLLNESKGQPISSQKPFPQKQPSQGRKSVLVILTGSDTFLDDILEQLSILQSRHNLTVVPTQGFLQVLARDDLQTRVPGCTIVENIAGSEIDRLIKRHDLILIPLLTLNTLAKVALGLEDSIAPILIIHAMLNDKPILAVKEGVTVHFDAEGTDVTIPSGVGDVPAWSGAAVFSDKAPYKNPATHIGGLYEGYLRTLEQWGIKYVAPQKIDEEAENVLNPALPPPKPLSSTERQPQRRQIITRDDLFELKRRGVLDLRIAHNAIVTDAAREFAHDHSIRLIEEKPE